jgi:hypothetical protein
MNTWDYIVIGTALLFAILSTVYGDYANNGEFLGGVIGSFIIFWLIGAGILFAVRYFTRKKQ